MKRARLGLVAGAVALAALAGTVGAAGEARADDGWRGWGVDEVFVLDDEHDAFKLRRHGGRPLVVFPDGTIVIPGPRFDAERLVRRHRGGVPFGLHRHGALVPPLVAPRDPFFGRPFGVVPRARFGRPLVVVPDHGFYHPAPRRFFRYRTPGLSLGIHID